MFDNALFALTSICNFICLVVSLWLGFYIVTRSPRSKVSWLASATLWALSGTFLNTLINIHTPPGISSLPWWQGWTISIAVPFWFHLSVSLLPDEVAKKRRPLVILIYLLTLNFIAMEVYTPWVFADMDIKSSIYYSAQRPGLLYPLFGLYLIVIPSLSFHNLWLSWKQVNRTPIQRQFAILLQATSLAIFSGIYATLSTWLGLEAPTLISTLSLGAGVALLGYGVARWNALIEGRVVILDFFYTSLVIGLITGAYLIAAWVSNLIFNVPFIAFVFILILAIASHSLYDWVRTYLDRIFYSRQKYRELRANLRDLARSTTSDHNIQERLQVILQTLCQSLDVSRGFMALQEGESFIVFADWEMDLIGKSIELDVLTKDEITHLSPPNEILGLPGFALIVPLHASGGQIGAIVLSQRVSSGSYSEDDTYLLEDMADTIASVAHIARLQERSVQQIDALLKEVRDREQELQGSMQEALTTGLEPSILGGQSERETISLVEDALRHLHDFTYLGEHSLAHLRIIDSHLDTHEGAFITHIDRGRVLQEVMITAIDKLKPSYPKPSPPTREWHQYVILHDCYVEGKLTREVMNELYISEGTFNRSRRRAVRGLTRALSEMEREVQRRRQI